MCPEESSLPEWLPGSVFQGFMNIAVAVGLIPNTGIPLPFVSYGLTSLLSLYLGVGFVLNDYMQSRKR